MKRTHPGFWGAGWAGLFVGVVLTVMGVLGAAPSETARLAGGYGLLVMGAAVYLLGGLAVRDALRARRAVSSGPAPRATSSAQVGAPNS